jgi:hypothetical protein
MKQHANSRKPCSRVAVEEHTGGGTHLGAVLLPKRHQRDGLRVASRFSWMSAVRHRYTSATTCAEHTPWSAPQAAAQK